MTTSDWAAAAEQAMAAGDSLASATAWRNLLTAFYDAANKRPDPEPDESDSDYRTQWNLAYLAMLHLGGDLAPALTTMADYNSDRYGPMLGVSDEGSATAAIRQGARAAPKAIAMRTCPPLALGVTHDAERLGAIGEVAVGPDEYATIRLAARGRVLTSTNVGTRVNRRLYQASPRVTLKSTELATAEKLLTAAFTPFARTVSGRARQVTVYVGFSAKFPADRCEFILKSLQQAVMECRLGNASSHHLGLYVNPGSIRTMAESVSNVISLAASVGIERIAVDGLDDERFPQDVLATLLTTARTHSVVLQPADRVDPQTTARHIWTGLCVARAMGLELGKYGLVPLTLEEQNDVITRIQYWMKDWCAAPVYYIDYPLVTAERVFGEADLVPGIRHWLKMVATHHVRVVLIDTGKKDQGRRLLKDGPADLKGFLTLEQISELTAYSKTLDVKVLWAGGVSVPQAYALGRLGIFGLYVTTAAAQLVKMTAKERRDPALLGTREPDQASVTRVKLLIEAGFLFSQGIAELEGEALALIQSLAETSNKGKAKARTLQESLHAKLVAAWRTRLGVSP